MEKTVVTRLKLEIGSYLANLSKAGVATGQFAREVSGAGSASSKHIKTVGTAALVMGAAVAAGVGMSVKAAIDWESAWAGVTKTTGHTREEMARLEEQLGSQGAAVSAAAADMAELEDGLRGLATELPATHKEIAAVAEAAGQLGIKRDALIGFTRTMVDLGETTNLTADEAATSIAQMANIMGTSQFDVDRLGASLVELGNNGASTEAEILAMSLRLAGMGQLIGASESDVLALANAMASLGIQAELGGGAMSRTLQKLYTAVKDGGDKLEGFAEIAGMTASEFATAFENEPMVAVDAFIQGLSRIEGAGGNVITALREVGIKGTQDLQVLLRLKGAGDLLAESIEMGSRAWLENTALQEEAAKRYETTASKLGVLRNQVVDVGIDIGGVFLPALSAATDGIGTFVTGLGEIDGAGRTAIVAFTTIGGGALGLIGLLGTAGPKIKAFRDGLLEMGTVGQFAGKNLGLIAGGLAAAGAAVAIYSYALGRQAQEQQEAENRTREYTDAIQEQGDALGVTTDELTLTKIVAGDVGEALRTTGSDLSVFTDAINEGLSGDMLDGLQELELMLRGGFGLDDFADLLDDSALAGSELGDELLRLAETGDVSDGAMARLVARIREQSEAYETGKVEAQNQADATKASGAAAEEAVPATEAHAQALKAQEEAATLAADAIKELIDAERAAIDPLFAMLDATWGNRDAQAELKAAIDANADANADNNVSLEELDRLQRAAAQSALDMNGAALSLAGAIESGAVNVDIAKGMLADWVEQSLITQETAERMGVLFDEAAQKADVLAGDRVVTVTSNIDGLITQLDIAIAKANALGNLVIRAAGLTPAGASTTRRQNPEARGIGNAAGGLAGSGPMLVGPTGSDTIRTYLTPGEFVVRKEAVDRIGVGALTQMNATGTVSAGSRFTGAAAASSGAPVGGGGGGTTVNVSLSVAGSVHSKESLAREVVHAVRAAVDDGGGDTQAVLGR